MIEIKFESILDQDVDVIVNPANSDMSHAGGLAGAIVSAAGPAVDIESKDKAPVSVGDAIITAAGELPQKFIVHAVGPLWDDGDGDEHEKLRMAYESALGQAMTVGSSVALPAISCGIFRFPVEEAAPIAIEVARRYEDQFDRIVFCVLDDDHYDAFMNAL